MLKQKLWRSLNNIKPQFTQNKIDAIVPITQKYKSLENEACTEAEIMQKHKWLENEIDAKEQIMQN